MSRRQLSRHEREERLRRVLIGVIAAVLLAIIAIPLVGYYREVLTKGSQPVAVVYGEPILLDDYAKVLGYRSYLLSSQIQQLQSLAAQNSSAGNAFAQQLQQLQSEQSSLDSTVLSDMIDDRMIAREAMTRGIAVTAADESAEISNQFGTRATPTAAPNSTPAAGSTVTAVATATIVAAT